MGRTCQVLNNARVQGDYNALSKLIAMLQPETATLEIADTLLQHVVGAELPLHPRPYPQLETGNDFYPMPPKAACAAMAIKKGLYFVVCSHRLHQPIVQKLSPYVRTIINDWLEECLWSPLPASDTTADLRDPTSMCAWLLELALRSGPEIRDEVLSSEGIVKYAIGAYAIQGPRGEQRPYMSHTWGKGQCPIVTLLSSVLEYSEDNRERALNILGGRSKESRFLAKRVVENSMIRCQLITQMTTRSLENILTMAKLHSRRSELEVSPAIAVFSFLSSVLSVAVTVCQNPALARSFVKSPFFNALSYALQSWLVGKSDRQRDREARLVGFKMAGTAQALLEEHARTNRGRSHKAHRGMVESGLVSVILEGIQSARRDSMDAAANIEPAFLRLKRFCYSGQRASGVVAQQMSFARGGRLCFRLFGTSVKRVAPFRRRCPACAITSM